MSDEIMAIQERLRLAESAYNPKTDRNNPDGTLSAYGSKVKAIRNELFKLTGDPYGRIRSPSGAKVTTDVRPSNDRLEASYLSPDDVPADVSNWVKKHCSLLFSDATDAVRWSRIEDTLGDDRYEDGEITLYRAINVSSDEIRPGDWVTTLEHYAIEHNRRCFDGKGIVLSIVCDGLDVLQSPTGNFEEAIFAPREYSGKVQHRNGDSIESPTIANCRPRVKP